MKLGSRILHSSPHLRCSAGCLALLIKIHDLESPFPLYEYINRLDLLLHNFNQATNNTTRQDAGTIELGSRGTNVDTRPGTLHCPRPANMGPAKHEL